MNDIDETTRSQQALRDALEETMADVVGPPVTELLDVARDQGRRIRGRRRAGAGLGLAVLAAAAVLAGPQLVGGSSATDGIDRSPEYLGDPTPSTSAPAGTNDAPGWWDMPAPEMLDRLEPLLPDGTQIVDSEVMNVDRAPGEAYGPMQGYLLASLTSPTSNGPGGLNLMLSPPTEAIESPGMVVTTDADGNTTTQVYANGTSTTQRISCPGNLSHPDQCTELRDAEGRHYGRTSVWTGQGVTIFEVVVEAGDGGLVYLATSNSIDDKWGAGSTVSADQPPLDLSAMRAIVRNPTWTSWTP